MEKLDLKDIPSDLHDMLEEQDIMYTGSEKFDKAMINAGFFEYGSIRRSHRIVTNKAHSTGYFGIIEVLTGLKESEVRDIWVEEARKIDLDNLFELAEKYGYNLVEKNNLDGPW